MSLGKCNKFLYSSKRKGFRKLQVAYIVFNFDWLRMQSENNSLLHKTHQLFFEGFQKFQMQLDGTVLSEN